MTIRSAFLLCLAASGLALAADPIEAFGHKWALPTTADWTLSPAGVLELLVPRPSTQPRRPSQYALAETEPFWKLDVELEAKAEQIGRAHV